MTDNKNEKNKAACAACEVKSDEACAACETTVGTSTAAEPVCATCEVRSDENCSACETVAETVCAACETRSDENCAACDGKSECVGETLQPDPQYILEVHDLKKYFPIKKSLFGKPLVYLKAVDNVSFSVKPGTTIGVVGESGCGKTTLGRTILKLYEPNGGKIFFEGNDITDIKRSEMQIGRAHV